MAALTASALTFPKLTGPSDYSTWILRARAQLAREGLLNWIQNSPGSAVEREHDQRALGLILLTVSDNVLCHLAFETNAKDAWEKLERLYHRSSVGSRVLKYRELFNLKLLSIGDAERQAHVQRMTSLFNSLELLQSPFSALQKGMILLSSLGACYEPFYSSYSTASDTEVEFDKVSGQLDNWIRLRAHSHQLSKERVNGTNSQRWEGPVGEVHLICWKCQLPGHIARKCPGNKGLTPSPRPLPSGRPAGVGRRQEKKAKPKAFSRTETDQSSCFSLSHCKEESQNFVLDSGASHSLAKDFSLLENPMPVSSPRVARLANGAVLRFDKVGALDVPALKCKLREAFACKDAKQNILSVSQLAQEGYELTFKGDSCRIFHPEKEVDVSLNQRGGIYVLEHANTPIVCTAQNKPLHPNSCVHALHRTLGHRQFRDVLRTAQLAGLKLDACPHYLDCLTCQQTKVKACPIPAKSTTLTHRRLQLVQVDLCGPFQTSVGGNKFFLCAVDHYSRYAFIYLLKKKSDAAPRLMEWIRLMDRQYPETPLLAIQTDRGGEWKSAALQTFLAKKGVKHQFVNPFQSLQNAQVERRNLALQSQMKALLHDANMGMGFWGEAIAYANDLYNRTYCSAVNNIPYVLFHGSMPDLRDLHTFGTSVAVFVHRQQRLKRGQSFVPARFVGFEPDSQNYRCLDLSQKGCHRVIITRSVRFASSEGWERLHINKEVFVCPEVVNLEPAPTVPQVAGQPAQPLAEQKEVKQETVSPSATPPEDDLREEPRPGPSGVPTQPSQAAAPKRQHSPNGQEGELKSPRVEELATPAGPRRGKRIRKAPARFQVSTAFVDENPPDPIF